MTKREPRTLVSVALDNLGMGKNDTEALDVCDCFQVLDGPGYGPYPAERVYHVNHHGLEVPGCIIFDGDRFRTSRIPDYTSLSQAVLELMRGN